MQGANAQRMIRSIGRPGFRTPKGYYKNVSNRERQRMANRAIAASQHAMKAAENVRLILLAVLGQCGGEVTVTDGTLQQIAAGLAHMDYVIAPGEKPGESIVRLVEGKDEPQEAVPPADDAESGTPLVVNDSEQGNP